MNKRKTLLNVATFCCIVMGANLVPAKAASSHLESPVLETGDEMTASQSAKPLSLWTINYEHFKFTMIKLAQLPLDAHLLVNEYFVPDSVVLAGKPCHFEKLGEAPCATHLAKLPKRQLNELLGFIFMHASPRPEQGPLNHYRHYLATLFAANSLLNVAKYAADQGNWKEALDASNSACLEAASHPAMTTARNAAWKHAWSGACSAADHFKKAKSASSSLCREEQANAAPEKPILIYLVTVAAETWRLSYHAALDILKRTEEPSLEEAYLATWSDAQWGLDELLPYLQLSTTAEKLFKDSLAMEAKD